MAERTKKQVLTHMVATMLVSGLIVIAGFYAIVLPLRAEDHERELTALWVGIFDNEQQVKSPDNLALPENRRAERQRYIVSRVEVPALGPEILLLQLWTGDDLATLYRQRLVRFTRNTLSGTVTQETFSFKTLATDIPATPEQLRGLTEADLSTMGPQCASLWERREDRRTRTAMFVGTMAPQRCERSLRSGEKVFIEAETRIDEKTLAHREAGARADGSYVFGGATEQDFYRFDRIRANAATPR